MKLKKIRIENLEIRLQFMNAWFVSIVLWRAFARV